MSIFKTTVIAGTTTAGGMLGKTIGATVLGSTVIGILPFAAMGAYIGYKLVSVGSNLAHKEKPAPGSRDPVAV